MTRSEEALAIPTTALPAWRALGAAITSPTPCQDPDAGRWTGTRADQQWSAERCLYCPAMVACADYARAAGETEGTWGGLTAAQRKEQR